LRAPGSLGSSEGRLSVFCDSSRHNSWLMACSRAYLQNSMAIPQVDVRESGCQSLEVADDMIYLVETHPLDILLAILITWLTFVGIDALALLLDYFAFLSEDASRPSSSAPTDTPSDGASPPES
jgi:hypothetical protein